MSDACTQVLTSGHFTYVQHKRYASLTSLSLITRLPPPFDYMIASCRNMAASKLTGSFPQ